MKCYRKNGSDRTLGPAVDAGWDQPSMKCYRKNGSDLSRAHAIPLASNPQ